MLHERYYTISNRRLYRLRVSGSTVTAIDESEKAAVLTPAGLGRQLGMRAVVKKADVMR